MASLKSIVKSKAFFIYSFLMYLFLSFVMMIALWQYVEMKAYNHMVKTYSAVDAAPESTVLIVIDDKAVSKHRWPWKRELYGQIFEYLNKYSSPSLIGFDAILASSDLENIQSDINLYKSIHPIKNLTAGFTPYYDDFADKKKGNTFLEKFAVKYAINVDDSKKSDVKTFYNSLNYMPDGYFNSLYNAGTVNVIKDDDGYLRRSINLSEVKGKYYPSLALRMYMLRHKVEKISVEGGKINIKETNMVIPSDLSGYGFRNYTKYYKLIGDSEYTHKKYSAGDILESLELIKAGKKPVIDPKEFEGKVVFVGANAKATALGLEDALPTPMLDKHPGVDFQATNFDNINNNQFMKMSSLTQDFLTILLIGALTFFLIYKFSFVKSLLLIVVMGILYYFYTILCYKHNFAVNVITPLALQLVTMVFAYSYRFILEGRNKEKIKNAMGKYLSQDIMKNVVKNIDDIKLGGKRAIVTVLFADIRGFTSMSEKMTAEEVSLILNEYFSEIEPIITRHNGVINKFIGDAVMAIFGEPIFDINHAQNAVRCAYDMLKKVEELQDKWIKEGKPKIEIGIGINTGEAFVGNIGSEKRLEYTVIGDMVNLASRIESYNKVYKTHFLISSSTYDKVSDIVETVKISDVQIRGKEKRMDIYEVLKIS